METGRVSRMIGRRLKGAALIPVYRRKRQCASGTGPQAFTWPVHVQAGRQVSGGQSAPVWTARWEGKYQERGPCRTTRRPAQEPRRRCARWRVRPVTAPERAPADLGSMLLLLTRHARAPERDTARWPDDSLRPLTNLGREFHAEMSRALARIDGTPGAVLTSPWVRARQTAD